MFHPIHELREIFPVSLRSSRMPLNAKAKAVPLIAAEAPTPLALSLRQFEEETESFRKLHRLIDAIEVFTKLHTVLVVSDLFRHAGFRGDEETRGMLAVGLKTPALGIWWTFAREFAKRARRQGPDCPAPTFPDVHGFILDENEGLFSVLEGKGNLINFRNACAHGATPSHEKCLARIQSYEPRLRAVVAAAVHLRDTLWIRLDSEGRCLKCHGPEETPIDPPCSGLQLGHAYVLRDGVAVDLHPLLVHLPRPKGFYFYNDLKVSGSGRASSANFLNYDEAEHWQDGKGGALTSELLGRYPIGESARTAPLDFAQRVEELTEVFKGRAEDLGRLLHFVGNEPRGFLMVWGGPGIGKSALLARFLQMLRWSPELRRSEGFGAESAGEAPDVRLVYRTLEYFIRRGIDSTDNTDKLLDNLNTRLDRLFAEHKWGIPIGRSTEERQYFLGERLRRASGLLQTQERLVLLIDGLDEAEDSPFLLESLPKEVPAGILIVYASRDHPRVRDRVYRNLDRERKDEHRLSGLGEGEARAILAEYVSKYRIERDYLREVAQRSEGNPLYLKLLARGLIGGEFRLNDSAGLPRQMEEIYERTLARISTEPGVLRLLQLLAAARDRVSPRMANELLGLDISNDPAGTRLFPACAELLVEDTGTADVVDYQLFHESLRDYLRRRYREECQALEKALLGWCQDWNKTDRHGRRYALRHLASHARSIMESLRTESPAEAAAEYARLRQIGRADAYQEASFRILGTGAAYQEHCRLLLEHADLAEPAGSLSRGGPEAGRHQRAASVEAIWNYHTQPERRSDQILRRIDDGADALRELADLAEAAASPRERVLRGLRGLETAPHAPIPADLETRLLAWCDQAPNPEPLRRLVELATDRPPHP